MTTQPRRAPADDQPGVAVDRLQRLWAPWRSGYIGGSDEIEGCPFCVLPARGPEHDRDSLIVRRDRDSFVILNAYPYNPGHLMVVPFQHAAQLDELPPAVADELWRSTRSAIVAVQQELRCEGVNVGLNLGAAAGAGIAEHVHLHVVPRWVGDTSFMSVVGATRVLPKALDELYGPLAQALR